jgi:hypothetical protein
MRHNLKVPNYWTHRPQTAHPSLHKKATSAPDLSRPSGLIALDAPKSAPDAICPPTSPYGTAPSPFAPISLFWSRCTAFCRNSHLCAPGLTIKAQTPLYTLSSHRIVDGLMLYKETRREGQLMIDSPSLTNPGREHGPCYHGPLRCSSSLKWPKMNTYVQASASRLSLSCQWHDPEVYRRVSSSRSHSMRSVGLTPIIILRAGNLCSPMLSARYLCLIELPPITHYAADPQLLTVPRLSPRCSVHDLVYERMEGMQHHRFNKFHTPTYRQILKIEDAKPVRSGWMGKPPEPPLHQQRDLGEPFPTPTISTRCAS